MNKYGGLIFSFLHDKICHFLVNILIILHINCCFYFDVTKIVSLFFKAANGTEMRNILQFDHMLFQGTCEKMSRLSVCKATFL
jgi:hypothetical protein